MIGSNVTSWTSRMPSAQMVVSIVSARFFVVGHGPRSASPTIIGSTTAPSAPIRLRPMTLRRVILDSSTTLSQLVEHVGDVFGLGRRPVPVVHQSRGRPSSVRAHWTAPIPMNSSARPKLKPSSRFLALVCRKPKSTYQSPGTAK